MPYNSETETFYQAPATVVDSTPDGDTVQEGFDDRLTPALAGVYADFNLLKADGMISVGIPATTTSRGIARVATLADMEPGAVVENGPAFPDVQGGVITTTPTPNAVPQADADGKLDAWVSLAGKANNDLSNLEPVAEEVIRQNMVARRLGTRSTIGEWTLTDVKPGRLLVLGVGSNAATYPHYVIFRVKSGASIGHSAGDGAKFVMGETANYASCPSCVCVPDSSTVVIQVIEVTGTGITFYAEQI